MAPNIEDARQSQDPNHKTLHVWSKPIDQPDEQGQPTDKRSNAAPTISKAVGMIKKDDFTNIHNTPCARQGFLAGIAAGAGVGGLKFVLRGNAVKAANWAVGMFILGSTASYEYCQYLRRAERIQMKRHIEVVTESKREQARKAAEEKQQHLKLEQKRIAAQKPWYKVW
ncbi:hypothetical protein QQS21_006731 [Conoideocrella luteorostrata]|uniref:Cytochrome c oxidase assembly protein COX20, mitochondrial n=1 Tax=Conoideocrella luteorostrata TaxID=1105319 RepID=A0AAJ0FT58_9HYPO|nr:hypothetical protein QQS21_006731 [Conoideocrella luteorostrata]